MIIQQKIGTLDSFDIRERQIDWLRLEWWETNKRILHKRSSLGRSISIRFLNERPGLSQNDVLFEDAETVMIVDIVACESIVVRPASIHQLASLCYEIGNKHLPLFMEGEEILIPFEEPLFRLLVTGGYMPAKAVRKLLYPLRSTVQPHEHGGGSSLLTRILNLTNSAGNG